MCVTVRGRTTQFSVLLLGILYTVLCVTVRDPFTRYCVLGFYRVLRVTVSVRGPCTRCCVLLSGVLLHGGVC